MPSLTSMCQPGLRGTVIKTPKYPVLPPPSPQPACPRGVGVGQVKDVPWFCVSSSIFINTQQTSEGRAGAALPRLYFSLSPWLIITG